MCSYSIKTDPGTRYGNNEDTVGHDRELCVWLVADGSVGHAAGEVASQIVRDTFIEQIKQGEGHSQAALNAHRQVVRSAEAQQAQEGMGSTLVAMQIADAHAALVWVGDSRAYLWRCGHLSVVTHDHSYVQMLIDQGLLTDETARDHPKRNMVTQVLGLGSPEPETRSLPLQTGDWLVLCSDGLNDELTDAEIAAVLHASQTVKQAADDLVARALAHGGKDNVSVVAVEYDGPAAKVQPARQASAPTQIETPRGAKFGQMLRSPVALGITAAIAVVLIFWIVMGA